MTESPLRNSLLMYRSLFCCVGEGGREGGGEKGGWREGGQVRGWMDGD